MDALIDIERLGHPDEETAKRALERLRPGLERFLGNYLRNWLQNPDDRLEVAATTILRVWVHRRSFEARGEGAWWAYVAKIARRAAYDRLVQLGRTASVPLDDELDADDQATVEAICRVRRERGSLYRAADELWLQRPPEEDEPDYRRRLFAAQLLFLHRRPWREVAETVGFLESERAELDRRLQGPDAVLGVAYAEIHLDGEGLAGAVLAALPPETLSPDETQVVVWRCRNGLRIEKILQMAPQLTRPQVEEILARVRSGFPFVSRASVVRNAFRGDPRGKLLAQPDLWKRIAFQYHAQVELPQRQIEERTAPAAKILGYDKLSPGTLNVWISGGRLVDQLARYVRKRGDA